MGSSRVQSLSGITWSRRLPSVAWSKVNQNEDTAIYKKFGELKDKVLTVKLNSNAPEDWSEKWTDELKKTFRVILKLFIVIF